MKNFNELQELAAQKSSTIQAKSLYFRSSINFDFFVLPAVPGIWMVNEKVADALKEANITGGCLLPFQQGDDFTESIFKKTMRIENPNWPGFKRS